MDAPHTPADTLLGPADPDPVGIVNPDGASDFFLICDHAGNAVPAALAGLGLPPEELNRHIGFDIGALMVAEGLAERLDAVLLHQRYSRLVIESNRLFSAPDSIAAASDGTVIPGNQNVGEAERARRRREIAEPYHAAIARRLDARAAAGRTTILVSMHSFTPTLRARPTHRPWQVGLCWGTDDRFTKLVLEELRREAGLVVGANEPYSVGLDVDYSVPVHGEARGLPYVEFEVRQDLIATAPDAAAWADRLAQALTRARARFPGPA